jgi:AraC-like DNA-binding protein
MKFEFVSKRDFNPITELAKQIGCKSENNIIEFPENMGQGYIKMLDLDDGLKLVIHRHRLKEELIFLRNPSPHKNSLLTITFNTIDRPVVVLKDTLNGKGINLSSIYITSSDIGLETYFASNKNIHSTIIIIHAGLLLHFLETHGDNRLIKNLTSGNQSLWYESNMTPQIQNILIQINADNDSKPLNNLFFRIKIQELIYQLFVEILDKENRPNHALKSSDIEKIYLIRETIISSLNSAPLLYNLARTVGMSETKMKLLFRQIFGKSIYNYFQGARMDQAADLLKHFSVAETGDQLGFNNMSYFSRLFEKHFHMKPKKFKTIRNPN